MKTADINARFLRPLLPGRPSASHKGNYGKVLLVSGSRGMSGAAVLAGRAALRAGAGLLTIACPDAERRLITCALPEAMTLPLPSRRGAAALKAADTVLAFQREKRCDVCLIGPGISLSGEAPEFVVSLLEKLDMPSVVDADALNALSRSAELPVLKAGPSRIFTPHEGEAGRFFRTPPRGRSAMALSLRRLLGGVCVLKGPGTLVTDGRTMLRNTSGGPALAKGGTGDVLAGLVAGLWAQAGVRSGFNTASALARAALGVHLHGRCGDLAAVRLTRRCVLAGELLDHLPEAFRELEG